MKIKKNSDLRQTTYKEGDTKDDDSYAHYERTNGTDQKRRQYLILKRKAKKYGVKVDQPQQQQDPMMGGGMM